MRSGINTAISLLVVDSDTAVNRTLRRALEEQGYVISSSRSGREATALVHRKPADLVLLDTEAQSFDVIETCRWFRSAMPRVGIVVVLSCDSEEERIQALEAGADDCVSKSFSTPVILARLRALCRHLRMARRAAAKTADIQMKPSPLFEGPGDMRSSFSTGEFINPPVGDSSNDRPELASMSLRRLRAAVRNGEVSFPSQVPIFGRQSRTDIQWRLAQLYFVRGWCGTQLANRYKMSPERIRQILSQWARRAIVLGYLQEIPAADAGAAGYGVDT